MKTMNRVIDGVKFGAYVRGLRIEQGISQVDLSITINKYVTYINRLECGHSLRPKYNTCSAILLLLGVEVHSIDHILSKYDVINENAISYNNAVEPASEPIKAVNNNITFGKCLTYMRVKRGMTVEQLAFKSRKTVELIIQLEIDDYTKYDYYECFEICAAFDICESVISDLLDRYGVVTDMPYEDKCYLDKVMGL
jgi:transcriptional regulator with XRE-family HTH domain